MWATDTRSGRTDRERGPAVGLLKVCASAAAMNFKRHHRERRRGPTIWYSGRARTPIYTYSTIQVAPRDPPPCLLSPRFRETTLTTGGDHDFVRVHALDFEIEILVSWINPSDRRFCPEAPRSDNSPSGSWNKSIAPLIKAAIKRYRRGSIASLELKANITFLCYLFLANVAR